MKKLKKSALITVAVFLLIAVVGSTVGIIGRLSMPEKESSVVTDFGYIKESFPRGQGVLANKYPEELIKFEPGVENYDISGFVLNGSEGENSYSYHDEVDSYAEFSISKEQAAAGFNGSRIGNSLYGTTVRHDWETFYCESEADICIDSPGDASKSSESVQWFMRFDIGSSYGSANSMGGIYFHRVENTAEDPDRSEKYFGISIIIQNKVVQTADVLIEYGTWHNYQITVSAQTNHITDVRTGFVYLDIDNVRICLGELPYSGSVLPSVSSIVPRGLCGGLKFRIDNFISCEDLCN